MLYSMDFTVYLDVLREILWDEPFHPSLAINSTMDFTWSVIDVAWIMHLHRSDG